MDYDVITIDTSIFEQHDLKLESGLLWHLAQFKEGSAEFVMPDVIYQELIRHLRSKTCEASESLSGISKKIEEFCLLEEEQRVEVNKILDKICPEDIVDARLEVFKENTGLKILRCSDFVDVDEILVRYYETRPPFAGKKNKKAGKKNKKAEFPDAFALLCLEKWANKENQANKKDKKILAISKDDGWKEFGASSSHIDVIEDLGEALKKFQLEAMLEGLLSEPIEKFPQGDSRAMKDANTFLEELYDDKRSADMEDITDTLIVGISNLTPLVKFDSTFHWDLDTYCLEFRDFKLCPDKFNKESTHLVRVSRNEIVILMRIKVSVMALANFQLVIDDSVGDFVEKKDRIQLEVLLTLNREEDTVKLIKTELTSDNHYPLIDFGLIDIGWNGSRF